MSSQTSLQVSSTMFHSAGNTLTLRPLETASQRHDAQMEQICNLVPQSGLQLPTTAVETSLTTPENPTGVSLTQAQDVSRSKPKQHSNICDSPDAAEAQVTNRFNALARQSTITSLPTLLFENFSKNELMEVLQSRTKRKAITQRSTKIEVVSR